MQPTKRRPRGRILCARCLAVELAMLPSRPGSTVTVSTRPALEACNKCRAIEPEQRMKYHVITSHHSTAETLIENELGGTLLDSPPF